MIVYSFQYLFHSKIGDDWPNSQIPTWIEWRYGSINFLTFFNEVKYWVDSWATGQGRFFPMAYFQTILLFTLAHSQFAINLVYGLVFLAEITIWVKVIIKITKSYRIATIFLLLLGVLIRFRTDFEPHIGFGLMLPMTIFWIGLSLYTLLDSLESLQLQSKFRTHIFGIVSGISMLLALCTYELAIFALPAIFIIAVGSIRESGYDYSRQKIKNLLVPFIALISLTSLYLGYVFLYLRPKAHPTGAYVLGVNVAKSLRAFLIQEVAVLPIVGINPIQYFLMPQRLTSIIVVFTTTSLSIYLLRKLSREKIKKSSGYLIATEFEMTSKIDLRFLVCGGFFLIISPALMISLQPAWWPRLNWGHSYIGIALEEIGLALILSILFDRKSPVRFIEKAKGLKRHSVNIQRLQKVRLFENSFFIALISILVFITSANNMRVSESSHSRDKLSASWEALTNDKSLFEDVHDRDIFLSTTYNDAFQINAGSFYSRTHIRLTEMWSPLTLWPRYSLCESTLDLCPLVHIRDRVAKNLPNVTRSSTSLSRLAKYRNYKGDWPSILLKPGALDSSKFFFFNIYMISTDVALAYLVPINDNDTNALANIHNVKLVELTAMQTKPLNISFKNACLKASESKIVKTSFGPWKMTFFAIPTNPSTPTGESIVLPRYSDIRSISTGVCR